MQLIDNDTGGLKKGTGQGYAVHQNLGVPGLSNLPLLQRFGFSMNIKASISDDAIWMRF
jgi:hypothetical protein